MFVYNIFLPKQSVALKWQLQNNYKKINVINFQKYLADYNISSSTASKI